MVRLGALMCVLAVAVTIPAAPPPKAKSLKEKEPTTPFVKWAAKAEFASNAPNDPIVIKGKVIVGTDVGELRAYGCEDGKLAWVHNHGKRIYHKPSSDGERLYFSSAEGLTAVDIKDGTKVWSFDVASCDGPTLALPKQGLVYVGGNDGNLYAVDGKTGKQRWVSDFVTDAPPDRPGFPGARGRLPKTMARPSAMASDGEALFLSIFDQSRVVAIGAGTGKRLWAFQANGWVFGEAVATAKHVYFGSQDRAFYCLNKNTGKQVW
jgi:outer membrane protein assembly factor BamB